MAFASEDAQRPEGTLLKSDATAALDSAICRVNAAIQAKALWIPAKEALEKARNALGQGEYAEASEQAHLAQRLAELGLEQAESPPYRPF